MRIVAVCVFCFGLAWTWLTRPDGTVTAEATGATARIGAQAPAVSLSTPDEKVTSLEEYRGSVVVLNFWASWCPPCKVEMPALEQVHRSLRDQGVVVLAVNQMESAQTVTTFALAQNLTMHFALDTDGKASQAYRVAALPTTYFIDRRGIIRDIVYGGPMTGALIESKVLPLLDR